MQSILSYVNKNISIFTDIFIEFEDSRCEYSSCPFLSCPSVYYPKLAEPGSTLTHAKYLCSVDPTCAKFFLSNYSYDKGTYYKCPVGVGNDHTDPNTKLYIKGKILDLRMATLTFTKFAF